MVKNLVHKRGIDGIDWRWLVERRSRFASLDKTNGLPHPAAKVVIYDQARIFAQAGRPLRTALEMVARERRDDQPTCTRQSGDGLAQGHAANDGSESHSQKFQIPNSKFQLR